MQLIRPYRTKKYNNARDRKKRESKREIGRESDRNVPEGAVTGT